jgi:hypothetical protein
MNLATEPGPGRAARDAIQTRLDADTALECDRCGRAVRRQTGAGEDDCDDVVLCRECEFGAD